MNAVAGTPEMKDLAADIRKGKAPHPPEPASGHRAWSQFKPGVAVSPERGPSDRHSPGRHRARSPHGHRNRSRSPQPAGKGGGRGRGGSPSCRKFMVQAIPDAAPGPGAGRGKGKRVEAGRAGTSKGKGKSRHRMVSPLRTAEEEERGLPRAGTGKASTSRRCGSPKPVRQQPSSSSSGRGYPVHTRDGEETEPRTHEDLDSILKLSLIHI